MGPKGHIEKAAMHLTKADNAIARLEQSSQTENPHRYREVRAHQGQAKVEMEMAKLLETTEVEDLPRG